MEPDFSLSSTVKGQEAADTNSYKGGFLLYLKEKAFTMTGWVVQRGCGISILGDILPSSI